MGGPRIDRIDKNYLINGDFLFAQRSGFGVINTPNFKADRFRGSFSGFTNEVEQEIIAGDVPFGGGNSLKIICDATNVVANDFWGIHYAFEGQMVQALKGKKIGITWYTKTNHDDQYSFNLFTTRDGAEYDSFVTGFDVVQANGWERHDKIIDLTGHDPRDSNAVGMSFAIELKASATRQTSTPDIWNPENGGVPLRGITGQGNFFDTIGNEIQFSKVMVYEVLDENGFIGDDVYMSAGRSYAEELALCQRYFQKWGLPDVNTTIGNGAFVTTTVGSITIVLRQEMRTNPIMSSPDPTGFRMNNASNNFQVTSINAYSSNTKMATVNFNSLTVAINGSAISSLSNAGSSVLHADAEL